MLEKGIRERAMDPKFPYDLYDDKDYIVERSSRELKRAMYAHMMIGAGMGVMFTCAAFFFTAWLIGV